MAKTHQEKLEDLIHQFAEEARAKLNKALVSSTIPDDWLNDEDDLRLAKSVMDSVCRDRPFRPVSPQFRADADNLHLCI